jgi:hypothetical protein
MQKLFIALVFLAAATAAARSAEPTLSAETISVRKIWDRAPHNAFTDLIRYRDRWYCVFREGKAHVSPDGALRVIASADGETWESSALLTSESADLRDAKLSVTPDGRLMLIGAGAWHKPQPATHQSLAWFSEDGRTWGEALEIGEPDMWLWRATWHKDKAYGIGYGTNKDRRLARLYQSADGRKWETLVSDLFDKGYPNESALLFDAKDNCLCLLRRDADTRTAQLGSSKPPYMQWHWKDLGHAIGGPNMIRLPSGEVVAATRLYEGKVRTSLSWVDPEAGEMKEFLALPSGGDTSYAGLAWHDGLLWVSYYSSHETKTSIYLAKVKFAE